MSRDKIKVMMMRLKIIILMVIIGFITGCSDEVGEVQNTQSSLKALQPTVTDDSLRPPKPPSI